MDKKPRKQVVFDIGGHFTENAPARPALCLAPTPKRKEQTPPAPPSPTNPRFYCSRCGGRRSSGALCCEGIVPKVPAECLWCGESLSGAQRAFCDCGCRRAYGDDMLEQAMRRTENDNGRTGFVPRRYSTRTHEQ